MSLFSFFAEMALLTVSVFLSIVYAGIMLTYLWGWRALPEWQMPEGFVPKTKVSVIIPARNEAANIEACLRSILEGSYPHDLLEIIVVDDFSEDATTATVHLVQGQFSESLPPRIVLLRLSDFLPLEARFSANKKKALEIGIAHATGELIVTTDADCVVPVDWLRLVVSRVAPPQPPQGGENLFAFSPCKIVAGPVSFSPDKSGSDALPPLGGLGGATLQRFQSLDFLGLMGITGAGIQLGFQRMGNGANLAYPKAVFEAVGGFSGNEDTASGDDMFLVQKVAARWPGSVFFLKNAAATVLTEAPADWRSFLQQRLRWGTKNAALPEWPVRLVLLAVFLFCWSILTNSVLAALAVVGVPANNLSSVLAIVGILANNLSLLPIILLFQLTVKAFFDYIFLREMCRFFKREDLLRWFVPSFFLHILYVALVGIASIFFRKYKWKGRQAK